jgi:hypothetical protein
MRTIGVALSLLAFWLQWSSSLRDYPFVMRLTASGLPIGRAISTARDLVAMLSSLAARSRFPLLGLGLLLIGPVALPTLAYASPPDPTWIPGIYDDADHDDVVTLATSATGDVAPALPSDVGASPPLVGRVPRFVQPEPRRPAPSAVHSRAPPAS